MDQYCIFIFGRIALYSKYQDISEKFGSVNVWAHNYANTACSGVYCSLTSLK